MTSYNHIVIMGRLTRDVDLRHTSSGHTVAKFGVATNHYRGKDKDDSVCFVDCVAFGKTAENISNYFTKGNPIHFDGRLDYSQWEDKETGKKRSKHEIVVEHFQFIPKNAGKKEDETAADTRYGNDADSVPF